MPKSNEQRGNLICIFQAILWSFFPVVSVAILASVPPIRAAALATFASSLFFAVILTMNGTWSQLLERRAWRGFLVATVCLGIINYGLLSLGLKSTGAGNGGILSLTEVFFSFLILSVILRHERLVSQHIIGAALTVAGVIIVLLPKSSGAWLGGELLVIAAAAIAPIGNIFAKEALKYVDATTLMFVRSGVSSIFLLSLSLMIEGPIVSIDGYTWLLIIVSGIVLMGLCKILWMQSIQLLPITKCISLSAGQGAITLVLASIFLKEEITTWQILGFLPIFLGVFFLIYTKKRASHIAI